MRYLVIFLNVLVVCLLYDVRVITSWSTMDVTCKKVALDCLDDVGRTNFIIGLTVIHKALKEVVFNFSAVTNKTLLDHFCGDLVTWSNCFDAHGCTDLQPYVRKQLYPVHILCDKLEDFMASPDCWKGKTAVRAMLVCIRGTNKKRLNCDDVYELVACMKYMFKDIPDCSVRSENFVGALLDEYLKYDAGGYCAKGTLTV